MAYIAQPTSPAWRTMMRRIYEAAQELVRAHKNPDSCHHDVCSRLADDFDLWELSGPTRIALPDWLMFIVSGIMRDMGMS